MSNQIQYTEKVTDVIQVMKAGVEFYEEAEHKVDNDYIKATFRKMSANKKAAIEAIQPFVIANNGEREEETSLMVEARKTYTHFISTFTSNEDHIYVKQLEEVEDKVLEVLDEALEDEKVLEAKNVLTIVRADAQKMHDQMKALQEQTKH
jgi:uncharacterized protein (TIGR02284 family)